MIKEEYNQSIREKSAKFLADFCLDKNISNILEIGTNKGESAVLFLSFAKNSHLTTIEKDKECFLLAQQSFEKQNLSGRVLQILGDAKEEIQKLKAKTYDLIFLDGPKGQYINYLPHLLKLLTVGGYLIADNVFFHGKVNQTEPVAHKHRTIVVNLRKFLFEIQNNSALQTDVFDIDDGISVSKKLK